MSNCIYGVPKIGKKVIWELTNNCNLKCIHCCNSGERNSIDIELEDAIKKVSNLKRVGVTKVVLGGGEPTMYKYFDQVVTELNNNDFRITVASNGYNLKKKIDLLKRIKHLKVVLSLDGFSSETHDDFRKKRGSFERVMTSIDVLKTHSIPVKVAVTIHRKNIYEIDSLISYMALRNIRTTFHSIIKTPSNEGVLKDYFISRGEYLELSRRYEHSDLVHFKEAKNKTPCKFSGCPAGKKLLGIRTSGLFTPCPWISYEDNSADSQSVDDVVNFNKKSLHIKFLPCNFISEN